MYMNVYMDMLCGFFLVSADVTNLFRHHFRKPCADSNVASASPWLHIIASTSFRVGKFRWFASVTCSWRIFFYQSIFFKLPRHFRETFFPRCFQTPPRVLPRAHTNPVMTRRILPKTNDKKQLSWAPPPNGAWGRSKQQSYIRSVCAAASGWCLV